MIKKALMALFCISALVVAPACQWPGRYKDDASYRKTSSTKYKSKKGGYSKQTKQKTQRNRNGQRKSTVEITEEEMTY